MSTTESDLHHRARRRVKMKMGFAIHAVVYVIVNLGLFAIDRATGGGRWHLWPLFGWGLGLAIHGVVTWFALDGGGIRERWVEREVRRLRDER
jgi:hypothetical protein